MLNTYQDIAYCVPETLSYILQQQTRVLHHDSNGEQRRFYFSKISIKNTIPFLLYEGGQPFQVEGVATCFDKMEGREKFICFKTFIFRIKAFDGHCAVLELLKFKHHMQGESCDSSHTCTPCCQIHCEAVADLVATGVCIRVDASSFTAIQCLPAISL